MSRSAYGIAAAAFLLIGCHSIKEELPTQPSTTPASGGVLTIPIPKIPAVGHSRAEGDAHPGSEADAHSGPGSDAHAGARRPRRRAAAGAATRCRRTSPA